MTQRHSMQEVRRVSATMIAEGSCIGYDQHMQSEPHYLDCRPDASIMRGIMERRGIAEVRTGRLLRGMWKLAWIEMHGDGTATTYMLGRIGKVRRSNEPRRLGDEIEEVPGGEIISLAGSTTNQA